MQAITILVLLGFIASSSAISLYKKPKCPESSNEEYIVIPNPDDCTSYYRCENGKPRLEHCSEGLHFDADLMTCNYPEDAGCEKPTTTTEKPTTSTEKTTPSTEKTTTSTDNPEEKPGPHPKFCNERKVKCPPQTSIDDDVIIANPDNCESFCHCSYGYPWWTPCPSGLQYNDATKECDYPSVVKCKIS